MKGQVAAKVGSAVVGVVAVAAGICVYGSAGAGKAGSVREAAPVVQIQPQAPNLLGVLQTIPRSVLKHNAEVSIDNLSAIWAAAGFPAPPTFKQLIHNRTAQAVPNELYSASPLGAELWGGPLPSRLLGYQPLDLTGELSIGGNLGFGLPSSSLSEVFGPITASKVVKIAKPKNEITRSPIASGTLLNLTKAEQITSTSPFQRLMGTRYIAVPATGGRLISGGNARTVTRAANGTRAAHSLASDPAFQQMLAGLGSSSQSLSVADWHVAFSEVVKAIYGRHPTTAQKRKLADAVGIKQLLAGPVLIGWSHVAGGPRHQTDVAAALYPSAADAQSAVGTVAKYAADGKDAQTNKPFTTVFHNPQTTVSGALVTMTFAVTGPHTLTTLIEEGDFPLFWAP